MNRDIRTRYKKFIQHMLPACIRKSMKMSHDITSNEHRSQILGHLVQQVRNVLLLLQNSIVVPQNAGHTATDMMQCTGSLKVRCRLKHYILVQIFLANLCSDIQPQHKKIQSKILTRRLWTQQQLPL